MVRQRTYKIDRGLRYTDHGVPFFCDKVKYYEQLDVCRKCGKKLTTCTLGVPPLYFCDDCPGTIDKVMNSGREQE